MKFFKLALAGAVGLGTLACASKQTPVRVMAQPVEMSALVGEWNGEYSSGQSGRSGSIVFRLKSASDTAYGDVVMVARANAHQVAGHAGTNPSAAAVAPTSQVLTIRFVRMEDNRLIGTLDPYNDPDCGCRLITVFRGTFTGPSMIEGTFESKHSGMDHQVTTGRWKVSRVSS